ncbi:MAG TPA: cbb3-type cytochrome c oxidase subunit 3, partial [Pseudomonadales bacterium]
RHAGLWRKPMTAATLFSLISITIGFVALLLWVYWPSRRERLEALGDIPFDHDDNDSLEKPNE